MMKFAPTVAAGPARPAMPTARQDVVKLAFDRASVRRTDQDGHLFIEVANLSAAGVSEYRSEEVVGWRELGLQPGQVVQLLRAPQELAKAAPSFCGKPLLLDHRPIDSQRHPHRSVIGAVGGDVRFEGGWLRGSMTVWDANAISQIENGSQRAISCAYRYEVDARPGVYQGERYQFRMVNLAANHVAIVEAPRVPGCFISDSAPKPKGKFKMARDDDSPGIDKDTKAALMDYLAEYLGPAELEAVTQILAGETVAAPEMAGDAAARRAADQVRGERGYLERFPGADRLR